MFNKKFDFAVLGATGMQGRIVTKDLLKSGYSVLLCGRDKKRVEKILKKYRHTAFEYIEMKQWEKVARIIKKSKASVCVSCVEGDWNLNALKACIRAGAHCVDLGSEIWMTKEQLEMARELKKKGLVAITGAGSVPGIGNVMLRHAAQKFDRIYDIEVGFSWDSNIKQFVVPFSIQSITEEFMDPAPVVKDGRFRKVIPLKTIREVNRRAIGKQREFIVRHPETFTFWHYFKDKGVKNITFYAGFPPHSFEKIKTLIDLGLASKRELNYQGMKIKPIDFITEILKDVKFPKGYEEIENLWILAEGIKNKNPKKILMECIVPTLHGWEDAGCNIDTGMPASIMAQMVKNGVIDEYGSFAPEAIIPAEPFFKELRKRKMVVYENGKIIN
jgi:saccharopine dehydrogenase-like NADP-dependent oxidoreductase